MKVALEEPYKWIHRWHLESCRVSQLALLFLSLFLGHKDQLEYFFDCVLNRCGWISHIVDDHVQEYFRVFEFLYEVLLPLGRGGQLLLKLSDFSSVLLCDLVEHDVAASTRKELHRWGHIICGFAVCDALPVDVVRCVVKGVAASNYCGLPSI